MLRLVEPSPVRSAKGKHVCIIGLGPSLAHYMDLTRRLGGRRRLADETWGINALGDVFVCDRIFHMDDVRIQEVRAAALPDSSIQVMLDWMKAHPGPIYTSRAHPEYPGLVEYPLAEVLKNLGTVYFNSTAAYAVGLAIHEEVARISLYGCDYTYANAHQSEKGRGCLEFWLGVASACGIDVDVSEYSSLMDSCETERLYGYGSMGSRDANVRFDKRNRPRVTFKARKTLPTAAEIEAAYDHSKHPSPLISGDAA
jgi:hypothetical protein